MHIELIEAKPGWEEGRSFLQMNPVNSGRWTAIWSFKLLKLLSIIS